jgi:hypothetical protein
MAPKFIRLAKRYHGFATQILRDIPMHRRMTRDNPGAFWSNVSEQGRLLRCSAIVAEDYYHLGLNALSLSFDAKRSFLGSFEKWRFFDSVTPPVYDIFARDKAIFHLLAKSMDIPVPVTLATTSPGSRPYFGRILDDAESVKSFLRTLDGGNLFFKPVGGSLGEGAFAVGQFSRELDEWTLLPGDQVIGTDEVVQRLFVDGRLGRFLIQRRLKPHSVVAEIVPNVCPTVRLMTLANEREVVVLGAALRIGSGLTATDNVAGGGLAAPIALEDGTISAVFSLDSDMPVKVDRHPLTGANLQSLRVPYWEDIKTLAIESARKMNFLRCAAWDIGVTDDGPVIIELNTRPRCVSIQSGLERGLLAGPLGAEFAKKDGLLGCGLVIR